MTNQIKSKIKAFHTAMDYIANPPTRKETKSTMDDQSSIIIIENGADDGHEHRIIGPFPSGDDANRWAFKHLEYGVLWYWLPLDAPALHTRDICKVCKGLGVIQTKVWANARYYSTEPTAAKVTCSNCEGTGLEPRQHKS